MGPENPNNPNQITNNNPVTVSGQTTGPEPPSGKKWFNFNRFANLWLVVFLVLVVIGILVIITVIAIALIKQPKKAATGPKASNALCFVRTAHLDCINGQGTNRVRYNIPVPPGGSGLSFTNLVPSIDRSEYLGWSANDPSPNDIWILNRNLKVENELNLPAGLTASDPSWTRNGQSILMAMENPQNSQQIYLYNPSSGNNQQITNIPQNTANPYQTKSGQILFGVSIGSNSWTPYLVNSDGTSMHPLGGLSQLAKVRGFDYDAPSDTVFVYGNDSKGKPTMIYGSVSDFMKDTNIKTLAVNIASGDSIGVLDQNTIIIGHNSLGTILNLTNPASPITVSLYGNLVGVLNTQLFQRSSSQAEQPFERIANLNSAPSSFQSFIEPVFTTQDAKCQANKPAQSNGEEYTMSIISIVSAQFATVDQGCGPTTTNYYALNSSGDWADVFSGNGTPKCSLINSYDFPTTIFQQCINPVGRLVPNNPQQDLQTN